MKYEGIIIRPPSEAGSLLLQVTVGCSHNKCTFCPTYKGTKFRIKSFKEIEEDILEARTYGLIRRVFLCDGDALIIPQEKLLAILDSIKRNLPSVERIGTYANAKGVLRKTVDELIELRNRGLSIAYLGIETGNEDLLAKIQKGITRDKLIMAGKRLKAAGITLSVTVLLGIGGRESSMKHASDTASILTEIDPDYVGALTVMVVPGTPLYEEQAAGTFVLPDTFGFLEELGIMIAQSNFTDCYFTSNHASNYLPVKARMPQMKDETVRAIQNVIATKNKRILRPEYMRGL